MANTYHQVYLHTIFAVKYREAMISPEWQSTLFSVIGNLINSAGCKILIVNGIYDHVHCFWGHQPVLSISETVKTVKSKSSKYINDHHLTRRRFEWQEGYAVFSYSHSQIDQVYQYITNQSEHHKKGSFREEYLQFLIQFNIPYDKRYIFAELI